MAFLTPFVTASAVLLSLTPSPTPSNAAVQSAVQSNNQAPQREAVRPTAEQTEPALAQEAPQCRPGQFLSPFSDVYPTDWAYSAVVQISSASLQCFDLPSAGERGRAQR
ncbi:MAG TPA: hypothetical protein V6D29_05075 [Leptolyngbyaceae cyanobacterium]